MAPNVAHDLPAAGTLSSVAARPRGENIHLVLGARA